MGSGAYEDLGWWSRRLTERSQLALAKAKALPCVLEGAAIMKSAK